MERYTNLDTVLDRVWRRLERAADDSGAAFRTPAFGTVQGNRPHLRTVVLRVAARAERRLAFHTDRRSQKVEDIRASARVAWHVWDADTSEQVRLCGTATVHTDDAVADALWADQDPRSLDVYVRPAPPGTPIDHPDEGIDPADAGEAVTRDDVASGRSHFAVVRTAIDDIDWLHLHPEGHYRARFEYDADAEAFDGTWIVP
jgi:hypothetical protein